MSESAVTASRNSTTYIEVPKGLHNVLVAETSIGDVRGFEGFYHYRQYSAVELARTRGFEDVWHLMLFGELPDASQLAAFQDQVRAARPIASGVLESMPAIQALAGSAGLMGALRSALSMVGTASGMKPVFDIDEPARIADSIALCAQTPTILAALHRLGAGLDVIAPRADLCHAANYLYMLTGEVPAQPVVDAITKYLISTVDHGFNASTFTARVITSTGADVAAGLVGALGALSGPLHGGAPSRALDTLDAIGTVANAKPWIRARIVAGDRIMGFGHPVYRTDDPRSAMLKQIALDFGGPRVELAVRVEAEIVAQLAELKPGRELHANVEFYAGVVMELCGLPRAAFTPTFAVARVVGWSANVIEQAREQKIFRPAARYIGPPAPTAVPALH